MSNLFKKSFIILGATLLFSSSVMATSIPSIETTVASDLKVSDTFELVGADGTVYPVYEKEVTSITSNESERLFNPFVQEFDWTIKSNKTEKTDSKELRKGDKVHLNGITWDEGEPIHIGITNGTKEYYSNLNSGYFDGYMTVKANGTYKFYIKNVGYNTISISGSTGHTAS